MAYLTPTGKRRRVALSPWTQLICIFFVEIGKGKGLVRVKVIKIEGIKCKLPYVRAFIGQQTKRTPTAETPTGDWNFDLEFDVTLHSHFFYALQVSPFSLHVVISSLLSILPPCLLASVFMRGYGGGCCFCGSAVDFFLALAFYNGGGLPHTAGFSPAFVLVISLRSTT